MAMLATSASASLRAERKAARVRLALWWRKLVGLEISEVQTGDAGDDPAQARIDGLGLETRGVVPAIRSRCRAHPRAPSSDGLSTDIERR